MILFIGLLIALVFMAVLTVLAITIGGSIGVLVFGDAIICGLIIAWIIKRIITKKKK